ncbi:hypothetical protein BMS3Bbin12_01461 [bacterium BMS3Bbin12]|nr:hypothetical protein BMS3Bbin12_01461 [bacterium BMS3Bbin12]GBE50793.1 hypothetical protein BMS3Bbin13_01739 [bacterium BMS3Bbin13]
MPSTSAGRDALCTHQRSNPPVGPGSPGRHRRTAPTHGMGISNVVGGASPALQGDAVNIGGTRRPMHASAIEPTRRAGLARPTPPNRAHTRHGNLQRRRRGEPRPQGDTVNIGGTRRPMHASAIEPTRRAGLARPTPPNRAHTRHGNLQRRRRGQPRPTGGCRQHRRAVSMPTRPSIPAPSRCAAAARAGAGRGLRTIRSGSDGGGSPRRPAPGADPRRPSSPPRR